MTDFSEAELEYLTGELLGTPVTSGAGRGATTGGRAKHAPSAG
jgi:hypothetical protein